MKFIKRSLPIGIMIVKNKVIQLPWGDRPTAIEISSSLIHGYYKDFFEEVWENAKAF